MGANSLIEWTHHTHCLWWGCTNVSPACDNCYAEDGAHHQLPQGWTIVGEGCDPPRTTRHGDPKRPEIWGPDAPRIFPPEDGDYIKEPFGWNRRAARLGERHRVFVMSMGDVFERHKLAEVNRMMDRRREMFFTQVVPVCTWLDFLLLTKRPHDILRLVPKDWLEHWPPNVWVGTTIEDQQHARQRLPQLVKIPAPVRFISAEPLLGPLDLDPWIDEIDWVICGGESGAHARPSEILSVRSLLDQVKAAGKAFFFKQWGNHAQRDGEGNVLVKLRTKSSRLLDGREWNEFPVSHRGGGE